MKVTMEQIANTVGVSRGTVDRALHGRSGVNAQVAEQIVTVAKQLGYRPAFDIKPARLKKKLTLGFVSREGQGIWADVMTGIERAATELAEYNVEIIVRRFAGYRPENELLCINEIMDQGLDGLAVVPINDGRIKARLAEIKEWKRAHSAKV